MFYIRKREMFLVNILERHVFGAVGMADFQNYCSQCNRDTYLVMFNIQFPVQKSEVKPH